MTTNARAEAQRLVTPVLAGVLGVVVFAAATAAGDVGLGLGMGLILWAYGGILLAFGRRSETVGLLGGAAPDERASLIGLRASAAAGYAVIVAVVAAFTWDVGHGGSGKPYLWLGAIGGLTFIVATIVLRRRS
jgi:hypothetical protein